MNTISQLEPVATHPDTIQTIDSIRKALVDSEAKPTPYPYWQLRGMFPNKILKSLQSLSLPHFSYDKGYGQRNLYNKYRHYFDQENNQKYPACAAVAQAFQSPACVGVIEAFFQIDLSGSSLRIEFTQDTNGFWLEPHTDIGAKLFTMLVYLSDGPGHDRLGTDIYASPDEHICASIACPNDAMAFVPSHNTWHGFEQRPIEGVRKTAIINYVTPDWQARSELAFPSHPVSS